MIHIKNKGGDVIRRSRNLRGVLDYARDVSPVQTVSITARHVPGESVYHVRFTFDDGSTCTAPFADWRVAADFLLARRSWRYGDWRSPEACRAYHSGPLVLGYEPAVARYYGEPEAA